MARDAGATSVMVTPSLEAVPSPPARIAQYFARIAERTPGLPIVLQDHPGSTGVHMAPELVASITAAVPEVQCIKLESLPTAGRVAELRGLFAAGLPGDRPPPTILTGLGALYGIFELEAGADGFMTGFAIPEVLMAMVQAVEAGRMDVAQAVYRKYLPLIVFEQQPGVAVRKELYRMRGLFDAGTVRHPGGELNIHIRDVLHRLVAEYFPEGVRAPVHAEVSSIS